MFSDDTSRLVYISHKKPVLKIVRRICRRFWDTDAMVNPWVSPSDADKILTALHNARMLTCAEWSMIDKVIDQINKGVRLLQQ